MVRATTVVFEGIPTYPDPGRWWELVDKFQVSHGGVMLSHSIHSMPSSEGTKSV